ncbi:uncharacterized protein LOC133193520 [Saccostrea echinata]|uniref:uncharacterized protein LOC133193520 n=1 Tax=Saccostrea echinata TaxID=191078 RepID=UPI002A7F3F85|nr:uncharacterized protein LOC133193520 [Saccostrea echinata]
MPPKARKRGRMDSQANPAKRKRRPSRRLIEAQHSDKPQASDKPETPQAVAHEAAPLLARESASDQIGQGPSQQDTGAVASVSGFGSTSRPSTNPIAPRNLGDLTLETNKLLKASMAENTWHTYKAAFQSFNHFRVGELACKSLRGKDSRPLQQNDIDIIQVNGHKQVKLTIRQSKTDQLGNKATLFLFSTGGPACPVSTISNFLGVRTRGSPSANQFLVHFDGKPLTRYQFSALLAKTLQFCNIKNGRYRSHSFRIGAATEAAMRGIPDQIIKEWGRWKSGAYSSYIRFT